MLVYLGDTTVLGTLQDLVSSLALPLDPCATYFSVLLSVVLSVVPSRIIVIGNFSGTKKTEEIMVARGSMLELLRIDTDTDKLVRITVVDYSPTCC